MLADVIDHGCGNVIININECNSIELKKKFYFRKRKNKRLFLNSHEKLKPFNLFYI